MIAPGGTLRGTTSTAGLSGPPARARRSRGSELIPHTGLLAASTLRKAGVSTPIRELTHSYAPPLTFASGYEARYFPYLQSTSLVYRESGGAYDGTHYATVATVTNAIDDYGTITDATTTWTEVATGDHTGQSKSRRIYHSSVMNDPTYWCIGRPASTHVTNGHTAGSGGARTRHLDQQWDAPSCRVELQTLEPFDTTMRVSIDLQYDAFGNIDR
jgi:hypothetical protein